MCESDSRSRGGMLWRDPCANVRFTFQTAPVGQGPGAVVVFPHQRMRETSPLPQTWGSGAPKGAGQCLNALRRTPNDAGRSPSGAPLRRFLFTPEPRFRGPDVGRFARLIRGLSSRSSNSLAQPQTNERGSSLGPLWRLHYSIRDCIIPANSVSTGDHLTVIACEMGVCQRMPGSSGTIGANLHQR
jgi:hypothetical protein